MHQMIVLAVSLLVYNTPRFFEFDYRPLHRANSTTTTSADTSTDQQEQLINYGLVTYHWYNIVYENVAYCLVAFFLPLSVLVFFNVRLMATLKSAEKFRPAKYQGALTPTNATTSFASSNIRGRVPLGKTRLSMLMNSEASSSSSFSFLRSSSTDPTLTYCTSAVSNPYSGHAPSTSATKVESKSGSSGWNVELERTSTSDVTSVIQPLVMTKPSAGKAPVNPDERNITVVMIIIILAFIVCETPAAINQILYYIVDQRSRSTCSPYMKFYHISNLLIVLNSALNFFIYFLFRRKFQAQLWNLVCCATCRDPATI